MAHHLKGRPDAVRAGNHLLLSDAILTGRPSRPAPPPRSSGPVRIDVPRESIDGKAVVLAGGAEEGTREDVARCHDGPSSPQRAHQPLSADSP